MELLGKAFGVGVAVRIPLKGKARIGILPGTTIQRNDIAGNMPLPQRFCCF